MANFQLAFLGMSSLQNSRKIASRGPSSCRITEGLLPDSHDHDPSGYDWYSGSVGSIVAGMVIMTVLKSPKITMALKLNIAVVMIVFASLLTILAAILRCDHVHCSSCRSRHASPA